MMAAKTPRANAYEYSPAATGPRRREIKANKTTLDKSAAQRQMDNHSAFIATLTAPIPSGHDSPTRLRNRKRRKQARQAFPTKLRGITLVCSHSLSGPDRRL